MHLTGAPACVFVVVSHENMLRRWACVCMMNVRMSAHVRTCALVDKMSVDFHTQEKKIDTLTGLQVFVVEGKPFSADGSGAQRLRTNRSGQRVA